MSFWNRFRSKPAPAPQPAPLDDDATFYEQLRYFQELADLIVDDTRLARIEISDDIYEDFVARPLHEMACRPIEATKFWETFDWPEDHAAHLLTLWRCDRQMEAWLEGLDAA